MSIPQIVPPSLGIPSAFTPNALGQQLTSINLQTGLAPIDITAAQAASGSMAVGMYVAWLTLNTAQCLDATTVRTWAPAPGANRFIRVLGGAMFQTRSDVTSVSGAGNRIWTPGWGGVTAPNPLQGTFTSDWIGSPGGAPSSHNVLSGFANFSTGAVFPARSLVNRAIILTPSGGVLAAGGGAVQCRFMLSYQILPIAPDVP